MKLVRTQFQEVKARPGHVRHGSDEFLLSDDWGGYAFAKAEKTLN